MEIVNNYSDGVGTQRQISETSRESEIAEDAVTETNVDIQENPAYNFRANVESVDYENGEEYENVVYNFTNIPIEPNPAYKVHSNRRLDEVSEYELIILTESPANEIVQQNQANNIITTQQGDTASDYSYEEIPEISTEQFYPEQQNPLTQAPEEVTTQAPEEVTTQAPEEVITTQAPVTTPVSPLKAICSFWQGKVEIAVRITILMIEAIHAVNAMAASWHFY
ncbi:uncharacterized protein LOC135348567 isoform X4 [Halichondria panicea]|uniref:uncharacterized protein LOC135348567 isoform X4 n=1 Tax=Halichondria panicea TaxID=6063 RepID=UPI00312BA458